MWFSRESYCTFAQEKFQENLMRHVLPGGRVAVVRVTRSACRELAPGEADLIPEHMRGAAGAPPSVSFGAVN